MSESDFASSVNCNILFANIDHQHLAPAIDNVPSKGGTDKPGADDENICQFRIAEIRRRVVLGRHCGSLLVARVDEGLEK